MKLEIQCHQLGIELEDIELDYKGKPEDAALGHFISQGYVGSSNEGITTQTVLKALMLDKLAEVNVFKSRPDACSRYLEAQFEIYTDIADEIVSSIKKTTPSDFSKNIREILSQPFIRREYPELSLDICEAIYAAIDTDKLISLARRFSNCSYNYRAGWPDLTLIKGKEVRFVEVKTSDKLHKSQLFTIAMLMDVLPYKISVLRIKKIEKPIRSCT